MNPFELYEAIKMRAGWTGGTPEEQRAAVICYQNIGGHWLNTTHGAFAAVTGEALRTLTRVALYGERIRFEGMSRETARRFAATPSEIAVFGPLEVMA
jgi:hypothetical protein